jgi:hypothetical protein
MKQSKASREKSVYGYIIYSDKFILCLLLENTLHASIDNLYPINFNHIHI